MFQEIIETLWFEGRKEVKNLFWKLVFMLLASALLAIAVHPLWNWLMPDLFGFKEIKYLQALGLILLSNFVLGR